MKTSSGTSGLPRTALRVLAATAACSLVLTACGSDEPEGEAAGGGSPSAVPESAGPGADESPSSDGTTATEPVADGLTEQGTGLPFGQTATVAFAPDQQRGSELEITVTGAREGRLKDFTGFNMDDPYKQSASYFYVDVTVANVGDGDVGGVGVPLWGLSGENVLLQPVQFTSSFKLCPTEQLPKKFGPGAELSTCLVYLSPDQGTLEGVSYRPDEEFDPITWTGTIEKPAREPGKKQRKKG